MIRLTHHRIFFLMFFLITVAGAEEYGREGVVFGISASPEISVQQVYSKIPDSRNSFTKTLGALATDLQLGLSKNGKNIHSIHASYSWYFPTERFLGAISSGYSFIHYTRPSAPSPEIGFETNGYFRLNGINKPSIVPGIQIGIKAGYEIKKHVTCLIGYLLGFENYKYSFDRTSINPNDLSNTIQYSGKSYAYETIVASRFQISLSYLYY
jgi:hypothetical protein